MRESCKAALEGSAKPPFRGQESSSFSRNPRTFLAFTSRSISGCSSWMLLRPAEIHTCYAAHSSEYNVVATGLSDVFVVQRFYDSFTRHPNHAHTFYHDAVPKS